MLKIFIMQKILIVLLVSQMVFGVTYYASPEGAGSHNGTQDNPFSASEMVSSTKISAGSTVILSTGTYPSSGTMTMDGVGEVLGSTGSEVTFEAADGADVDWNLRKIANSASAYTGSYFNFIDINFTCSVEIENTGNVDFEDCTFTADATYKYGCNPDNSNNITCTGCTFNTLPIDLEGVADFYAAQNSYCVYIGNTTSGNYTHDLTFQDCIFQYAYEGISAYSSGGATLPVYNVLIDGCTFQKLAGDGIKFTGIKDATISDCIFTDIDALRYFWTISGTISGTFGAGNTVTQATTGATGYVLSERSATPLYIYKTSATDFAATYTITDDVSGATITPATIYNIDSEHTDGIQFNNASIYDFDTVSILRNKFIRESGDLWRQGIIIQAKTNTACTGIDITNNMIYDVTSWGILIGGADDIDIINNTIIMPTSGTAIATEYKTSDTGDDEYTTITNFYNNVGTGFLFYNSAYVRVLHHDNNHFTSEGDAGGYYTPGTDENFSVTLSSGYFTDYSGGDFTLLSDSLAVDAASASYAPDTDIDGVLRPQGEADDIGAYEYYPIESDYRRYTFDEGEGLIAYDYGMVHHFNGQLINGPVWEPNDGMLDGALSFDGTNDYVQITDYKGILGTQSRTCCAWIKTTANQVEYILSWGYEQAGQKWAFRIESDGTLSGDVYTGYVNTTATVNDGQWHHVAIVLSDDSSPTVDEILLYIDGVVQSTTASSSQAIETVESQDVIIGAINITDVLSGYFDGMMDDVMIFREALSCAEIADIYLSVKGGCYNITQQNLYASVQSSIDAASDGDEIVVYPGTYYETITIDDWTGTLRSVDPNDPDIVAATIIDANEAAGPVVTFSDGAGGLLEGFTITGAYNDSTPGYGGGIYCKDTGTAPVIKKCVIEGNYAVHGGGMMCYNCSPVLEDCIVQENESIHGGGIKCTGEACNIIRCIITDNLSSNEGGGIFVWGTQSSQILVKDCLIKNNIAVQGGGFYTRDFPGNITNCTVVDNHATAGYSGGGLYNYSSNPQIVNSIFYLNIRGSSEYNQIRYRDANSLPDISYSCIQDCNGSGPTWDTTLGTDGGGNIEDDPNFVDPDNGDYHIISTSSCIDAGDNSAVGSGDTDIDGDDRIIDGGGDPNAVVDMGADEYDPS